MTPSALEFINALPGDIGPKFLQELQRRQDLVHNPLTSKEVGFGSPVSTGATTAPPQQVRGFSFSSPSCAGHDPFMAGRVGHSQECAGSCTRSSNLHGLPPSFGSEGAASKAVVQESIMTESLASTGATATSAALVPVFAGTLQGQPVQLCDARTLHAFMGVLRDFTDWVKARIRKFDFVEGVDFLKIIGSPEKGNQTRGGNRKETTDYHLTLDMAKELSMVENNDKGREARRYFMACEKQVIEQLQAPAQPERIAYSVNPNDTLTAAQAEQLRLIFKDKCDTLPEAAQAAFMTKGWSKMKSHFGVSYRKIEQREFSEAVSLATRHAAEWTVVDAVPAPQRRNALQSLPSNKSSQTLQLMIVTTTNGASTVELLPAEALPQIIMQKDGVFTPDQALKIAMHANLRMMGETIKIKSSSPLQRLRDSIRKLSPSELLEFTIDGWCELSTRTALTNELAAA